MAEFKISPEIIKKATEQRILQDAGFPTMPEAPPEIPVVRANPMQVPLPAPVNPLRTPVTRQSMGDQAVRDSMAGNVTKYGSIYHPDAAPRPTKQDPPKGDTPSPSPAPTTPSPSTGRGDSAPDGSGAKGTNTGFKGYEIDLDIINKDSARRGGRGMADVNNFFSEQLPVSVNEKQTQGKQTSLDNDDFILQAQAGGYLDNFMGGTNDEAILHAQAAGFQPTAVYEGASVPGSDAESPADTADLNRSVSIPGEKEVKASKPIRGAVDDRFAEGAEYGESYATDYSKSRQARRAAFLDPNVDSSVDAVRNANNAVGIARYGNKFYANDGGSLVEIDQSTYDAGRHSKMTAQQFKDGRVGEVKSTLVPVETPDVTDPDSKTGHSQKGSGFSDANGNEIADTEFGANNNPPIAEDTARDTAREQGAKKMREAYFNK